MSDRSSSEHRARMEQRMAERMEFFKFKLKIPKKVRRKYAGRKLKAKIVIKAKDPSGNLKKITKRPKVKFRRLKKKRR